MVSVIVVTNRKGGVGKTTIATHLAAGLALKNKRVGLVDVDPQGHSAIAFGMRKENGLYNIMVDESASFADVIRQVPPERFTPADQPMTAQLYLLPSSKGTTVIPIEQQSPFRFRDVLDEMADLLELDVIVVDTGPTTSMFDGSVNLAATHFVHVAECAALSFDGLRESINEINKINRQNAKHGYRESQILGIVPNKARFSTSNHRDNIAELAEAYPGMVWQPIVLRTVWEAAMEYGQMVYSYAPNGQEAADAWAIVDRVIEGVGL